MEVTLDLASTLDLGKVLKRVVDVAAELCGAEASSILLYDENNQQLYFEVATNLDEPMMQGLIVPLEGSLAGWIVTHREPVRVAMVSNDPRYYAQVAQITQVETTSLLGIPLINKDKVIGVLEVINKRTGEFTEADQEMMTALAIQAAVAIENARLFQQSDLIAELIHELRTPLASISTAAHLLLRPEVSEEQHNKMVEIIKEETFRLSEMATSFLDLAHLESGRAQFNTEFFDLSQLLEDCASIMRSRAMERNIDLQLQPNPDLPLLKADRNKIKQVVLNLLSNAIKYNRPGGSINVSTRVEEQEMLIAVADTGYGILPEYIPYLFERFYRTPGSEQMTSGTGLGLSICKRIVEAHQGHIEVESEVGIGTIFTAYLPVEEEDIR
jgi:signal transduction histidine kinase